MPASLHCTDLEFPPLAAGLGALQVVIGIQITINLKCPPRSGQWLVFKPQLHRRVKQNYVS